MSDPLRPRHGRGALSHRSGRFEARCREDADDGWSLDHPTAPARQTTVAIDAARSVIARNDSPDVPFSQSVNPYRGCEHGCVYCFARPTHAYLGLSPGLDFETRLFAKPHAPERLDEELRRASYRCQPIALGTNTDPYQPIEREHRVTRGVLEVLARHEHPVSITTKAALIERDIDLLSAMAERRLAEVFVSVTTLDRHLARRLEPRACAPARRLDAMRRLAEAGIPTGVLIAPVIPALNDAEIEAILAECRAAGALSAGYVLLRLPLEVKELFHEWLQAHVPLKAKRIMSLVRDTHEGRAYVSRFGARMTGSGPYADLIGQRFRLACGRLGLDTGRRVLDTTRFRRPAATARQFTLF